MQTFIVGIICILSVGCCNTNDNYVETSDGSNSTIDLVQVSYEDMIVNSDLKSEDAARDLISNTGPDLVVEKCGAIVCSNGFECCSDACVNTSNDPTNCGACGNICMGDMVCNQAKCIYEHHDTFCSNKSPHYWYDPFNVVSVTSTAQAKLACDACCVGTVNAKCPCTQDSLMINNTIVNYWTYSDGLTFEFSEYFYYSGGPAWEGQASRDGTIHIPWYE